jgi:hypothetical protein
MRMTASWSRSPRIDRIQVCGAIDRANRELPLGSESPDHKPVDMWTIGFADRLRFPRFPSQLESGEMLPFAHIPTGPAADKEIDVNGNITRRSACDPKRPALKSLDTKSPIQVRGLKAHGTARRGRLLKRLNGSEH